MTITIAGIPVSIVSPWPLNRRAFKQVHQKTLFSRKPKVNIYLHFGFPKMSLKNKNYVIGIKNILDIYQSNGKYIFVFKAMSNRRKYFPFKLLGYNRKDVPGLLNPEKIIKRWPRPNKIFLKSNRIAIFSSDFREGSIYTEFSSSVKLFNSNSNFSVLFGPSVDPLYEMLISNLLSLNQGLLFHGCGIMDKRKGYLFIGYSSSGKSTMAKLWQGEATVLSDELIAVRKINNHFFAFAIPWLGTSGITHTDKGVRLRKIFFLHHGQRNRVLKYSTKKAFLGFLSHSSCPVWNREAVEGILESCAELAQRLPCFSLYFVPDKRVLGLIRSC